MAFTRFHDDPARIAKQLQQQTDQGRWAIDVPGNGDKPCFQLDPQIIPQKWGGNLMTNTVNLESDLFGLTRNTNRDDLEINEYRLNAVKSEKVQYESLNPITDQSRATHPAWTLRDLEQYKPPYLPLNPQENTCLTFQNNLSTRILEKEGFVAKAPRPLIE